MCKPALVGALLVPWRQGLVYEETAYNGNPTPCALLNNGASFLWSSRLTPRAFSAAGLCNPILSGCLLTAVFCQKFKFHLQFSSVQSLSRVRFFATPWIAARQASLSITNSRSLLKLMPIELVMPSSHLILCRPLVLLPAIPPSIRVSSNE